jgi:hypothetical protein
MAIITNPYMWRRDQEARYGYSGNVLRCWPMVLAEIQDVTSPTVSIWRNGAIESSDALVSAAAATEDGTTHLLTYTLNSSDTGIWHLGKYRAEFTYTYSNVVHINHVMFDVVRQPLMEYCPVDINDIKSRYPPAYSALVQASLDSDAEERFILPAWESVLTFVEAQGRRPSLLSSPAVLRPMAWARTMVHVCEGLTRKPGDVWWEKAKDFRADYEEAKRDTSLQYDDSDGKAYTVDTAWRQPQLLIGNRLG